jgi:alpha-mannosidase
VRAGAIVTAQYRWPEAADPTASARLGEQRVTVTTKIELHADESSVKVTTTFVNPCRDHRLCVHFPLPERASASVSGSAFGTVTRGLSSEGRAEEYGLPTFPARDFVQVGGLTVAHAGVREHELVDLEESGSEQVARTLAMTVLRSTGMLSRVGMTYRPVPAGPLTPVEGLQMVGRQVEASYVVALGPVDPWSLADGLAIPLESAQSLGGGWRADRGSALEMEGARLSALVRSGGQLELRVFNPSSEETTVRLGDASGWLVDLRGRPLEPFDGSFKLRPYGFATARLAERNR